MADFSLNEDQLQIQKWIHGFAEDVIRPVAHEWDEREEFPYPVVEEAAKIGLYGWEFMMNAFSDNTGLTLPVAIEELFWGDAGIGMAIMGSALAAAGISGNGTPEQVIDKLATEWTTAADGTFAFHAADDAILEAVRGGARGWARLDNAAQLTHALVISIGPAPARDETIAGRVVDPAGHPLADVLVTATPARSADARAPSSAVTGADGGFVLERCDARPYDLTGDRHDRAPAHVADVAGGATNVTMVMDVGVVIRGAARARSGEPIPAYTLTAFARRGAVRELASAQSIVAADGAFAIRVAPGDYELIAAASGWAPSAAARVTADRDVGPIELVMSAGAVLRGAVVAATDGKGIPYARVMREALGGGASASPANAGTVTRADGTFELTGLPPGPVSITVAAGGFHPRIEAGLTAYDGASLGPLRVALTALAPGEAPNLELVGIGAALRADPDGLRVTQVFPDSGAQRAGLVEGDLIIEVDGASTVELGMDGSIGRIRGGLRDVRPDDLFAAGTGGQVSTRGEPAP